MMAAQKVKGRAYGENTVVPLAAGLIVGEAIMGVGYAAYQIFVAA